ncbi:MAG: hypothetical protein ACRCX2_05825 [Paraclostridium sp.]
MIQQHYKNPIHEPNIVTLECIYEMYKNIVNVDPDKIVNQLECTNYYIDGICNFYEETREEVVDHIHTIIYYYERGNFDTNIEVHMAVAALSGITHFYDNGHMHRINVELLETIEEILCDLCACSRKELKKLRADYIYVLMRNYEYKEEHEDCYIECGDDLDRLTEIARTIFSESSLDLSQEYIQEQTEYLHNLEGEIINQMEVYDV